MEVLKQWEELHYKKVGNTYKHNIKQFIGTANFDIQNASYSDIIHYISLLRKFGLSSRNLKNHLCAIKFYYNCLLELGYIKHHPCKTLLLQDKTDKSIPTETLFTPEELNELLIREDKAIPQLKLRNTIIRQLLVYQGLTVKELMQLTITDIDLENCTLTIKNSRELELHPKQLLPLQKYLTTDRKKIKNSTKTELLLLSKSGNNILTVTINDAINYKATKKFTPQKIRQSVIANLLKNGHDLRKVQLFAGHRYISSTEQYITSQFTELRSELEKKHPLS
ncbi:tyrosine-type recombinase/integrase [Aquimarina muelleri]|uniref:tyrosine-type recombinase/integrase n=1 Tax=Aquimarina muelleri TaxID=279356 RepID=UPI003F68509B